MTELSSLLVWFPKVNNLGILVPRTEIVKADRGLWLSNLYKEDSTIPEKVWREIEEKAGKLGYPLFLRTDLASGKHDWKDTCYVEKPEDLRQHVWNLIEANECADILGLPWSAFVFREFLELDWRFKAFREMPVARERRYFIKNAKVLCHHPYWPEDAICFWSVDAPEDWKATLRDLNKETKEEVTILTSYSQKIAIALDGYWSIDFAHAKDGRWILIDMGEGVRSWHPECPHKPKEALK